MWGQRIRNILKGVIGGAFVGLFLGAYTASLTLGHVIQKADFAHPTLFEMAEFRYRWTLILSYLFVFSLMGPFFAAVTFGPWMRHAVYGLLGCVALVVGVALLGALISGEQPFNHFKGASRTWIDAARLYGVPASFVIGPIVGILIGRYQTKRVEIEQRQ